MRLRKLLIIPGLLVLAIAGTIFALRGFGSRSKPHVLLITLDTVRWDHVSCYGRAESITPAIDRIAEEAVKYQYAITPSSWTLPAHASLFTGVLATRHGAHYVTRDADAGEGLFQANTLDPELPTLAGELKEAGYRTGAVISGPLLHSRFGMNKGFDYYDDKNLFSPNKHEFYRNAHETSSLAVRWLKHHYFTPDDTPFFLFLNYYDAHNPYRPPEPWGNPEISGELCDIHSGHYDNVFKGTRGLTEEERQILLSQYNGEIRYVDSQIEWLLFEMKQLGLYDSTLIIVTSDHGESFGEHRLLGHGRALYEELVRVPLIVKYPLKDRRTGVVERRVSTLSVMPTILEYIGRRIPETVACGKLDNEKQVLVAEIFRDVGWIAGYGNRFDRDEKAVYEGDYKWIWSSNGNHELYNIIDDPGEKTNLQGQHPDMEQRMQSQLAPLIEESKGDSSLAPPEIDDELKRSLEALGYIQ